MRATNPPTWRFIFCDVVTHSRKLYLCHHLEEGESHHLLGHLDHLVKADGDGVGVVVDAGQEGGGQGHVYAWLLVVPFHTML